MIATMIEKKLKALYETFEAFPELYQSFDVDNNIKVFYLKDHVVSDEGEDLFLRLNVHGVQSNDHSVYETIQRFMHEWIEELERDVQILTEHKEQWSETWERMKSMFVQKEPLNEVIMRISPKTEQMVKAMMPKRKMTI